MKYTNFYGEIEMYEGDPFGIDLTGALILGGTALVLGGLVVLSM